MGMLKRKICCFLSKVQSICGIHLHEAI
uniref:Uncharacterized protein n=1 Tax=Arundo donax TaxID=35708 RepID=A0A0A8YNH7_ARUDO